MVYFILFIEIYGKWRGYFRKPDISSDFRWRSMSEKATRFSKIKNLFFPLSLSPLSLLLILLTPLQKKNSHLLLQTSINKNWSTKKKNKTKQCLRLSVWWICKTIRISETQSHGFQVTTTTTTSTSTSTRPRLTYRQLTPHSLQLQLAAMSIASSSKTSSRSSLSSSPSLYCLSLSLILFIPVCFPRILG